MELRGYQQQLINDTRDAFRFGRRAPCVVLPCGGGKTVCFAFMAEQHIRFNSAGTVWFLVHRRELITQTVRTFDQFGIERERVFIGMVQTVSRNPGKFGQPTLIIFDEAHHATARTWSNIIEHFADVPVVGLTATPARTDGASLGQIFDELVIGPDAHELQRLGYLAEYDYYAPRLDLPQSYSTRGTDFDQVDVAEQFRRAKIYGRVLDYIDPRRKIIIYCPTIEFSRDLADQIPGAVHFDGNTPDKERDEIVERFRTGEIRVLLNVNLIGEGFDVPDCDCVILLRPTLSTILYVQQSMRCLRPADGKRAIIYDMVGNCYRHGLPTDPREWSLTDRVRCKNSNGEPDITARQCRACLLVYSGISRICPYCGAEQPKTRREIEQDERAELERIEAVRKRDLRREQGQCQTLEELTALGRARGYSNPRWWAMKVMRGRANR